MSLFLCMHSCIHVCMLHRHFVSRLFSHKGMLAFLYMHSYIHICTRHRHFVSRLFSHKGMLACLRMHSCISCMYVHTAGTQALGWDSKVRKGMYSFSAGSLDKVHEHTGSQLRTHLPWVHFLILEKSQSACIQKLLPACRCVCRCLWDLARASIFQSLQMFLLTWFPGNLWVPLFLDAPLPSLLGSRRLTLINSDMMPMLWLL